MDKNMKKICKNCGKEFNTTKPNKLYCDRKKCKKDKQQQNYIKYKDSRDKARKKEKDKWNEVGNSGLLQNKETGKLKHRLGKVNKDFMWVDKECRETYTVQDIEVLLQKYNRKLTELYDDLVKGRTTPEDYTKNKRYISCILEILRDWKNHKEKSKVGNWNYENEVDLLL